MDELLNAIEHFEVEKVEQLLKSGDNPNVRGYKGITPLHLAVDTEIEDALYRYDVHNDTIRPNGNLIRLLLSFGADVDAKDENGASALDWAYETNFKEAIEILETFDSKK